jgi:uncharacterized FlaG/YvyC family protein
LTDAEVLEYGKRQARALSDMEAAMDELRSFQTEIKNRCAKIQADINSLSERIRNGYEFRYVETTIKTDYANALVSFVRDDTGEIFSQRPLNKEERQFILDFQKEEKA